MAIDQGLSYRRLPETRLVLVHSHIAFILFTINHTTLHAIYTINTFAAMLKKGIVVQLNK